MVGYFYDNDDLNSKEWGETIESMSKWYTEAKEYKEKYEELLEKYNKLWDEYKERFEKKEYVPLKPNFPIPTNPFNPWWTQPVITYTTYTTNKLE